MVVYYLILDIFKFNLMPIHFQNLIISDDNFNDHVGVATYDIGTDKLIDNHYNCYYYLFLINKLFALRFFPFIY